MHLDNGASPGSSTPLGTWGAVAGDCGARHVRGAWVLCPKGTRLFLDRDGRLLHAWLARDTVVEGRLCRGELKIDVSFHPNGRVRGFFPPEDVVIDGVPCEASVLHPVALFPDGRLHRCMLAADCRIDGRDFEKGSLLKLDEHGRPGS